MVISWSHGGNPTHFIWNRRTVEIAVEDDFCLPEKFGGKAEKLV